MKHVVHLTNVELYEELPPWTRFARILVDPTVYPDAPLCFCVFTHPAGGRWPAHVHEDSVEIYYVLDGQLVVNIDGEEYQVSKKDLVYVPAGVRHWSENRSDTSCTFITVHCPAVENMSDIRKTWIKHLAEKHHQRQEAVHSEAEG